MDDTKGMGLFGYIILFVIIVWVFGAFNGNGFGLGGWGNRAVAHGFDYSPVNYGFEDYKQILNTCNMIDVEGDCGVLLSKDGKYLYLAEGKYWTSSFKRDQVGKIHPIHIIVSHGKIEYSTRLGVNALLNIIPIEKTENQFDK